MASQKLPALLALLEATPADVENLIAGLRDDQVRTKPSGPAFPANAFSIIENVCHLRDIEWEGYRLRIARTLQEEMPALPDIDGNRLAVERGYQSQDLRTALLAFAEARRQTLILLRQTTEEQLDRQARLESVGLVTLIKLVELMREHDESHLRDLEVLRRELSGDAHRADHRRASASSAR